MRDLAAKVAAEYEAGLAARQAGRLAEAAEHLEKALAIVCSIQPPPQAAGFKWDYAACLEALGSIYGHLGQPQRRLELLQEALEIYRTLEDTVPQQATCLFNMGAACEQLGQSQRGRELIEQALEMFRKVPGAERQQATCLMSLGVSHGGQGQHEREIELMQQALDLYRKVEGSQWDQAVCLQDLGVAYGKLGQLQDKLDYTRRALELYAQIPGTEYDQAICWQNLSSAFIQLGQYTHAIEAAQEALNLLCKLPGSEREQARCLVNLGLAHGARGEAEREIELYQQAVALQRAALQGSYPVGPPSQGKRLAYPPSPPSRGEGGETASPVPRGRGSGGRPGLESEFAALLVNLGIALLDTGPSSGKLDDAEAALREAEGVYRGIARAAVSATGGRLPATGKGNEGSQSPDAGASGYQPLSGEPYIPEDMFKAEMGLGRVWRVRAGLLDGASRVPAAYYCAYRYYARAVRMVEYLRGHAAASPELKAAYFAGLMWVYDEIISLLAEMKRQEVPLAPEHLQEAEPEFWEDLGFGGGEGGEAAPLLWEGWESYEEAILHYSEGARARVLRDLLANQPVTSASGSARQAWAELNGLLAAEQELVNGLAATDGRGLQPRLVASEGSCFPDAVNRLRELRARRRQAQRTWAQTALGTVAESRPVRLSDIRALLRQGEALIEYKALPRQLVICVVTASPAAGVHVRTIPVRSGEEENLFSRTSSVSLAEVPTGTGGLRAAILRRLQDLSLAAGQETGLPPGMGRTLEPPELLRHFTVAELVWLYRYPMTLLSSDDERQRLEALGWREQQLRVATALYRLLIRPVEAYLQRAGARWLIIVPDGALYYLPFQALVARLPANVDQAPVGNVFAAQGVQYALERYGISYLPSVTMYLAVRSLAKQRPVPARRLCAFADPIFSPADERLRRSAPMRSPSVGAGTWARPYFPRLPNTRQEAQKALAAFSGKTEAGPHFAIQIRACPRLPASASRGAVLCEDPAQLTWARNLGLLSLAATEPLAYAPQLGQYGYVLLSTHAVINPEDPLSSYIALTAGTGSSVAQGEGLEVRLRGADLTPWRPLSGTGKGESDRLIPPSCDGNLLLPEVFGLHLNARMVTLSACRTAEGGFARGEGILGLTAAFFVSGARAITASLWEVADEATADLIGGYHARMAAGEAPAVALRQAQLAMLFHARRAYQAAPSSDAARYAHPYYWAPFVVLGW